MQKILVMVGIVAVSIGSFFAYTRLTETRVAQATPEIIIENAPAPGTTVSYEFMATASGTVALDLVEQLADIETKDFGTAGAFITSINGLTANDTHFWSFYVNEQFAQRGVSQTTLREGDTIRFTYEEIEAP